MQDIERAAGALFRAVGMDDVADDPPLEADTLAGYVRGQRAWVADIAGQPVGYALADIVDGCGHLEQISVDPAFGRRGIGRRLIAAVCAWARSAGLPAVTLLTFRDVPWNGPYYSALGFQTMANTDLTPGLRHLRDDEGEIGLDTAVRQAMRLDLTSRDPSPA